MDWTQLIVPGLVGFALGVSGATLGKLVNDWSRKKHGL